MDKGNPMMQRLLREMSPDTVKGLAEAMSIGLIERLHNDPEELKAFFKEAMEHSIGGVKAILATCIQFEEMGDRYPEGRHVRKQLIRLLAEKEGMPILLPEETKGAY